MLKTKVKRSRAVKSNRTETILNCLLFEQIKYVLKKLEIKRPEKKTKSDFIEAILTSNKTQKEIEDIVLEVEISTVKKHCFFTSFKGYLPKKVTLKSFKPVSHKCVSKIALVNYKMFDDQQIRFLLEHTVRNEELKPVQDGSSRFELIKTQIRHPLVVICVPKNKTFMISYEGYTQGRVKNPSDRVSYAQLIEEVLNFFSSEYELTFVPLAFKQSLLALASAKSSRVTIVYSNSSTAIGELEVKGNKKIQHSVQDVIYRFLGPYLNLPEDPLRIGIEKAFQNANLTRGTIFWKNENVHSRITIYDFGVDLMFIWKGATPSSQIFLSISNLIKDLTAVGNSNVWEYIADLEPGMIVNTGDIANYLGIEPKKVKEAIKTALSSSILSPVFRIKGDVETADFQNNWSVSLSPFAKRDIRLVDETTIDGTDPSNIEVAFQRTSRTS